MTAFARERRKLPRLALAMIAANGAIGLPDRLGRASQLTAYLA